METEDKFYENLLGICFTSPDCEEDQYFHAFSFNESTLKNMIENITPKEEQKYYSIKEIYVFKYISYSMNKVSGFFLANGLKYDNLDHMYGFNRIHKGKCEQVILITDYITDYMKECGISHNKIEIDTFYGESIVNA
jgi:hypothetical protein